mgnify:CR=1 FL=1
MTDTELNWLNDYHKEVWKKISPLINESVKEWLKKDPQNERLLLLDDYLSNFLKLQ